MSARAVCPTCGQIVTVVAMAGVYQVDDHQRPVLDARGQATGWRACGGVGLLVPRHSAR